MFEKLKEIVHTVMCDDNEDHRQNLKMKAIEFQQSVITKMECPMCKSKRKTRPLIMRGWHDDPNIDYKKPDCYVCCRCGYIMIQVTEEEMALIDKALFISLGLKTENITNQVLAIETSGDDLLELAVNHVKEVMELAARRRKAVEVYNSITDTTNVCLYQSGALTQFDDFISAESMEQIKHSTIQSISNAKDEIEKQIMEKIGVKGRRYTGLDEELDNGLSEMEDQHSTDIISIDTKELIEKETNLPLTNKVIHESLSGMTEENVIELYWNQNLTIEKTAEQLGVNRSTLFNFICNRYVYIK